jgi:hypothetical protein
MATYDEIYGKRVEVLDADPTLNSSYEGQVWYNSTTGVLRTVVSFAAWSSAVPLSTARYNTGGCGTQTANLIFGGAPPGPSGNNATEEFNGSGWATGGNLTTSRTGLMGAGTQTAGLGTGGATPPATYQDKAEEYNGTSWSEESGNLSTGRGYSFTGGIQTAAWIAGGRKGPPHSNINDTEEYDGSSWTAGGALGSGGYQSSSSGPQTGGWAAGGAPTPGSSGVLQLIQLYDGSSWTNGPNAPAAFMAATGSGTQTTALVYGMQPPSSSPGATTTYLYDGSSFSVSPATLATARRSASAAEGPSGTAAILAGGRNTPESALTEEYNLGINTITAAAWASGAALNTARYGSAQMGTTTASLVAGGSDPSGKRNESEEYNGTSWTEGDNLNTTRGYLGGGRNSTQTAGLAFGGTTSTGPDNPGATNATEEYNGSSWTSVNNMNYSARNLGGLGTQTSALSAGGVPVLATSGEYDGTNWTAGTSLPAGLQDNYGMTGETLTAGLLAGGEGPPGSTVNNTFEYDGTNWTAGGTLPTATRENGMSGIQTAALMFGGADPSTTGRTIGYDGTAWSTRPSLGTARAQAGGAGTATAAFCAGGLVPSPGATTATEEFTGATETAAAKTLTTS